MLEKKNGKKSGGAKMIKKVKKRWEKKVVEKKVKKNKLKKKCGWKKKGGDKKISHPKVEKFSTVVVYQYYK